MDKKIVGDCKVIMFTDPDGNNIPLSSEREAVHMNLIYKNSTGRWYVLLYSGYSNPYPQKDYQVVTKILDLGNNSRPAFVRTQIVPEWPSSEWVGNTPPDPLDNQGRIFCSGHVMLEDGKLLVVGGHKILQSYKNGFLGLPTTYIFDPEDEMWAYVLDNNNEPVFMQNGRWYPTVTRLWDNKVVTVSGYEYNYSSIRPPVPVVNKSVEVYPNPDKKWAVLQDNGNDIELPFDELYPGAHMLPFENSAIKSKPGEVFYTMPMARTWRLNVEGQGEPVNAYFNEVAARSSERDHCNSLLLTIEPNSTSMKVLLIGGHNDTDGPLNSVEFIDVGDSNPQWESKANLNIPRFNSNSVILPDKRILVVGGCQGAGGRENAVTIPEMYDPYANNGQGSSTMQTGLTYQRMYHSTAILTPDATVLISGGETPGQFTYGNDNFEIFSPGYLHYGTQYPRPTIYTDVTEIHYNENFNISTDTNIISVMLIRFGCPTHAFDQDQRAIELDFTIQHQAPDYLLQIVPPADGYIAPAGLYMLFILSQGPNSSVKIPSIAKVVTLRLAD